MQERGARGTHAHQLALNCSPLSAHSKYEATSAALTRAKDAPLSVVDRISAAIFTRMRLTRLVPIMPKELPIINPRRACAERVTVVILCVCVCVCMCVCMSVRTRYSGSTPIKSVTKDAIVLNVRFAAIL